MLTLTQQSTLLKLFGDWSSRFWSILCTAQTSLLLINYIFRPITEAWKDQWFAKDKAVTKWYMPCSQRAESLFWWEHSQHKLVLWQTKDIGKLSVYVDKWCSSKFSTLLVFTNILMMLSDLRIVQVQVAYTFLVIYLLYLITMNLQALKTLLNVDNGC